MHNLYIYRQLGVFTTSVGLAQARPNYIRRMSFRKCKLTLLTRKIAHAEFLPGIQVWTAADVDGSLCIKFRPGNMARCLFVHIHKLQRGRCGRCVCSHIYDVHNKYTLKLLSAKECSNWEVAEDWRRPRNETELDVLQKLRNKGERKRRERDRTI